jgi:hypothetical protein
MSVKQAVVPDKVCRGLREFQEMIQSLLDPKEDPKKVRLRETVQAYRGMFLNSLEGAKDHPELLAFALLGQVNFNGTCPTMVWLEKLPTTWIAFAPHLKCGEKIKALVEKCKQGAEDRQLLCQAVSIVFLHRNRKAIEVVSDEGELLGGDTYATALKSEEEEVSDEE